MNVSIIGIGLIGGSFAKDIKNLHPTYKLSGIDNNQAHLKEALSLGLINTASSYDELSMADLVIVSIPVDEMIIQLPKILDLIKADTIVIDAGSTKEAICKTVADHKNRRNFLACHPIAGTEYTGPSAAIKGLFYGKTNILCEVEKTAFKLQEKAISFFHSLGMRIRYMNPVAHDKHIAYVSHLSHISSFMLGRTVIEKEENEKDIFDMAGSGFESTVRLAKSSPAMWTPIFKQNKDNVLDSLEEYIHNLEDFKNMLAEDNYKGIYEIMNSTNQIKHILKGIPLTNNKK